MVRETDPDDHWGQILRPSAVGRKVGEQANEYRRSAVLERLADWAEEDLQHRTGAPERTARPRRRLRTGKWQPPEGIRKRLDAAVDSAAHALENAPFDPGVPGGDPLERRPPDPRTSDPRPLPSSTQHALNR